MNRPDDLDSCVEWQGFRDRNGYGKRRVDSVYWLAHRYAWVQANGPIPDGLFVLHRCDNPPCVNVEHLFLGTQGDNVRDMYAKGRGRKRDPLPEFCKRGHRWAENTYTTPKGARLCRECQRQHVRDFRARKREL